MLISAPIERGPAKREILKALQKESRVIFTVYGEEYPVLIIGINELRSDYIKLLGYGINGLFCAEYDTRKKTGNLITKEGRVN